MIETSRVAVIAAPRSGPAWGRLGQAMNAAEFTAQAIQCYSNAVVLDPAEARWPYLLGTLELQETPDRALAHLERATELAGGKTDAPRYTLARALVERGEYDRARSHIALLIAANPRHAAARLELARVHMMEGRLKEATAELQWALTNQYTMKTALLLAAQVAQRNNQSDTAAQISRRAMAMPRGFDWPDPYLKEVQSLRGDRVRLADQLNVLLQQQRLPEAEAVAAKLIGAFPNDSEALLLYGRLRYLQKNCVEAEAAYRRHLEKEPNSLNGFVQLGIALMCQQQWTNAAAALERAVALKPDFGAAHHNLGTARSRAGDGPGAIRAFRDALRCTPGDVNVLFALAEELANAGQLPDAVDCVKRAEALSPQDPRLPAARQQLGIK
jgi:tetratricopeptide (TPR) repeat protein